MSAHTHTLSLSLSLTHTHTHNENTQQNLHKILTFLEDGASEHTWVNRLRTKGRNHKLTRKKLESTFNNKNRLQTCDNTACLAQYNLTLKTKPYYKQCLTIDQTLQVFEIVFLSDWQHTHTSLTTSNGLVNCLEWLKEAWLNRLTMTMPEWISPTLLQWSNKINFRRLINFSHALKSYIRSSKIGKMDFRNDKYKDDRWTNERQFCKDGESKERSRNYKGPPKMLCMAYWGISLSCCRILGKNCTTTQYYYYSICCGSYQ